MTAESKKPRIVILGAGGRLGAALRRAYREQFEVTAFKHADLDLADLNAVEERLASLECDFVINAAAFTNVDACETERAHAFRVNADAPALLARLCVEKSARLIHISTDYVFDGEKSEPYGEEDPARPVSAYGESKIAGEERVLATDPNHLVVRVSWVFGPDRPSFVDQAIGWARDQEEVGAVADKWSTPSYTKDLAAGLAASMRHRLSGLLHLSNAGQCTWQEYSQFAVDCCHEIGVPLKARTVKPLNMADMKSWMAVRPVYTVLSTDKYERLTGEHPRPWRDAVREYVREHYARL